MKKFITTLKNIWSIEELKQKILFTILLLFIYRIGCFIVLPGINPNDPSMTDPDNQAKGVLGLLDAFVGGSFSKASIFALGIMPYISASIFMQLVTILVPQFAKIQKEGESGRKKINQWTRYLTVVVTAFQAIAYIGYLNYTHKTAITVSPAFFQFSTVLILTVGTLFVMWMGEKITDKGLGNGTSIIIMIGILARFPSSFMQEWNSRFAARQAGGLLLVLVEVFLLVVVIAGLIMLVQGTRKVAVEYAKQIVGSRQMGGARNFLPLKVNSAGVMPIIFAQAILFLPTIFSGYNTTGGGNWVKYFTEHTNVVYMLVYSVCVIAFTFLYTALIFNPRQMADDLKRSNGFIPGVKPGQPTADYIGTIMDRITLPGSLMLAIVGIMPGLFELVFNMQQGFSTFFGGTSLLIMVGVILDTLQQIETQLLMRQYDGLMSGGARIQGRQPVASGM